MMTEINLKGPRRTKRNGFSLIELLIVVAIILIIAAIAIPNFLHARMAANESTAVSSIHAINTSEIAYSSANPIIGYSATLADLGPANSGYLDAILAGGTQERLRLHVCAGYFFAAVGGVHAQRRPGHARNDGTAEFLVEPTERNALQHGSGCHLDGSDHSIVAR